MKVDTLDMLKKVLLYALVIDIVVTVALFAFTRYAVTQTNHNAGIQRQSQYVDCKANNARAEATIEFATGELASQQKSLKDTLALPQFRDPRLARLGTANIRDQIKLFENWLKPYYLLNCESLYGINGKAPIPTPSPSK